MKNTPCPGILFLSVSSHAIAFFSVTKGITHIKFNLIENLAITKNKKKSANSMVLLDKQHNCEGHLLLHSAN